MSCKVTNTAQEQRVEVLRHTSQRHIASVTSPDGQRQTTNKGICSELHDFFQKLIIYELGLSSAQSNAYLADFPHLKATEAGGYEGSIMEDKIRQVLKSIGTDKTLGIDSLPFGESHVCSFAGICL